MKKLLFTLFCATWIIITPVTAQMESHYGLRGGAGLTNEISNLIGFDYKVGYELQGFYQVRMFDEIAVRLIMGYIQRGHRSTLVWTDFYGNIVYAGTESTNYHNITIGPDFLFSIPSLSRKVYLYFGTKIDWLVATDIAHEEIWLLEKDLVDGFKRLNNSVNGGLGIAFENGIFLELSANINTLNKMPMKFSDDSPRFFDYYVGACVGYNIGR